MSVFEDVVVVAEIGVESRPLSGWFGDIGIVFARRDSGEPAKDSGGIHHMAACCGQEIKDT